MAKPNFNLSSVLGNTKSNDTHTVELKKTTQEEVKDEKQEPSEIKELVETVKKCLLSIPIKQHRELKKFCATHDLKVSEFILLAIKEKLEV